LTTTSKAAFKPGWQEIRHENKIQPSKERLAYERVQVLILAACLVTTVALF